MLEVKGRSIIEISINGSKKNVAVRPADTLLYVLRELLGLTGAKNGCENGDCDACTVLMNGWPVKACLTLAVEAIGSEITTIEGLNDETVRKEFVESFAIQCGYCTPGMIVNSYALTAIYPGATEDVIDEWLESNICRCTGYQEIRGAVRAVLEKNRAPANT